MLNLRQSRRLTSFISSHESPSMSGRSPEHGHDLSVGSLQSNPEGKPPLRKLTVGECKVNKIFRRKESEGLSIAPVLQKVASATSSSSNPGSPVLRKTPTIQSVPVLTLPEPTEPEESEKALDELTEEDSSLPRQPSPIS